MKDFQGSAWESNQGRWIRNPLCYTLCYTTCRQGGEMISQIIFRVDFCQVGPKISPYLRIMLTSAVLISSLIHSFIIHSSSSLKSRISRALNTKHTCWNLNNLHSLWCACMIWSIMSTFLITTQQSFSSKFLKRLSIRQLGTGSKIPFSDQNYYTPPPSPLEPLVYFIARPHHLSSPWTRSKVPWSKVDQGGLERSFVVKALGVWSDSGYLLCLRPASLVAVGLACNEKGHGLDQGGPYYARSASAAPFQLASAAHTLKAKKMYEP